MPRRMRKRLLTPGKKKLYVAKQITSYDTEETEVLTPRGRLKGALKDVLEPGGDESDASDDLLSPMKRASHVTTASSSEEDFWPGRRGRRQSPQRYVLKLFDRSVDLSQFDDDSPLYPICRAWIANQPRMNYKKFGKRKHKAPRPSEDSVGLPGPKGPPVPRAPPLLPEQLQSSKDNINLDYRSAPPPGREQLLHELSGRWHRVRAAWLRAGAHREARYRHSQLLLNKISVSSI